MMEDLGFAALPQIMEQYHNNHRIGRDDFPTLGYRSVAITFSSPNAELLGAILYYIGLVHTK